MKVPGTYAAIFFTCIFFTVSAWAAGQPEGKTATAQGLNEGEKLKVVATTSIIADIVGTIGADHIDLTTLIPPGQNPHGYQPNPRQISAIEKAQLVFTNGLDLEEGVLNVVEHNSKGQVVEVSHGINILQNVVQEHDDHIGEHEEGEEHEGEDNHNHSNGDPHTWTSPLNVLIWVDNIENALSNADPAHEKEYSQAAEKYKDLLNSIDLELKKTLSVIPGDRRIIVTDHATFGYFARDYGFEVIGTILPSFSSNSEASSRHLAELLDILAQKDVPALFIDSAASDSTRKLAQTLSNETGRKIKILKLLTGTLATPGSEGDTYIGYLRYNAAQLVEGLTQ